MLCYNLFEKVTDTKSGKLFVNFLKKQNTQEENLALTKNLGYSSAKEFGAFLSRLSKLKNSFERKNEKIFSLISPQKIIEQAALKVANEGGVEKLKNPQYICWAGSVAIVAVCMMYVCNEAGLDECECTFEFCMSVICSAMSLEYMFMCLWLVD